MSHVILMNQIVKSDLACKVCKGFDFLYRYGG